jgi:MoxR-like ATPase
VIAGRRFVLPDDVKAVAISVLSHRLMTDAAPVGAFDAGIAVMQAILERVPAPRP